MPLEGNWLGFATALISLVILILNTVMTWRNGGKSDKIEEKMNGKMTELMEASNKVARAEGHAQGEADKAKDLKACGFVEKK
jgi:hypothetical protein